MTPDHKRNKMTTLFAALEFLSGRLMGAWLPKHHHQVQLRFLRLIDRQTASALGLPLILDNYAIHRHSVVQHGLARHPRFHLHFTRTSGSWLNLVERWFRELTTKRLQRGVFKSVGDLIVTFAAHHNWQPRLFIWMAKVEAILAQMERARMVLHKMASV